MSWTWKMRAQAALVLALFLGSLFTALLSTFQTLMFPEREFQERDRLREASRRMASAAETELAGVPVDSPGYFEALNGKLRSVTNRVLADFPGVEGGFYLGGSSDRFSGFGFPSDPTPPAQAGYRTDEPPPKEAPFILVQARHSLDLEPGEFQSDVRTVGPSRVVILTEPVSAERPARVATWTLYRMTDPEKLSSQLRRFQFSSWLALTGIAVASLLALNLGRSLQRQRLEQARLQDDLRRSEHLAALGKLLAGVAHEVRNPLAGLRSTVQLWERLPETARTPSSMHAVLQAVDRLNEIVTRLLYFSRADRVDRQPVAVNALLAETLALLEAQARAQGVLLEQELAANLPPVAGSAGALREVFLNLATNALQAMPQGGRLRCATRYLSEQSPIEIRFADTGPGVAPTARAHLFEPFFTTRPDGTGLGLALCREIVTQHGGMIELEDGGSGAVFRVYLPIAP